MKTISTSIYTFEDLITGGCLYVDKTEYMYRLITTPKGQFFCSRPRRFGKSLTVSTLDAIFKGKRELFDGLYIAGTDYDWRKYPVIHLDFAREITSSKDSLDESLSASLKNIAGLYGIDNLPEEGAALIFRELIRKLKVKHDADVVILIDEYDKPILDHMDSFDEAEEMRGFMDEFFQVIKGSEPDIRFTFITGVTKFAKVSIFSKLNNLDDITMREEYAEMFGYTDAELRYNFAEYIGEASEKNSQSSEELISEIKRWYDGFLFNENVETVYNPVSIGSFFNNGYKFKNYWFSTGTPTFLTKLLRRNHLIHADFDNVLMSESSFDVFDVVELSGDNVSNERLLQMLYQTGYLTIDKLIREKPRRIFKLKFPNYEVESSFNENLTGIYARPDSVNSCVNAIVTAADSGNTEALIVTIKTFFASLSYDIQIKEEKYYQSMFFAICKLSGMDIDTEVTTNIGRIDAVLKAVGHVYIIEFKLNSTEDSAFNQIDEKKYAEKYILPAKKTGDKVHKLGINFSYADNIRNITGYREEIV